MLGLISTDFDGTLFAEFENPAIPPRVTEIIGRLQACGAKWVINTGRDMASLTEGMRRADLSIEPDFLVLVEREIHARQGARFVGLRDWNARCARQHQQVFARVRPDLGELAAWINERFSARIYEDSYSPFCLIAGDPADADAIHDFLDGYCARVPDLVVVRNDVYMRFSHADFNKGTALSEVSRQLGLGSESVFAAGDHLNDLPMLDPTRARWLAAPANAVAQVKENVRRHHGHVSALSHGEGVAEALELITEQIPARTRFTARSA